MVTAAEAQLIADVRIDVASLLNLNVHCTTADEVALRYSELLVEKAEKDAAKTRKATAQMDLEYLGEDDSESQNDVMTCR